MTTTWEWNSMKIAGDAESVSTERYQLISLPDNELSPYKDAGSGERLISSFQVKTFHQKIITLFESH